jgi:hypothetical protein
MVERATAVDRRLAKIKQRSVLGARHVSEYLLHFEH